MNQKNNISKKQMLSISLISTVIIVFLIWLIYFHTPAEVSITHFSQNLPAVNALLNGITVVLLLAGLYFIKNGAIKGHIRLMIMAVFTSTLFVTSYITYHFFQGDTKFVGTPEMRVFYLAILISHIILSIFNVPLVLTTLFMAFSKKYEAHKKFAKITFPVWLYVSATGVLIYFLLHNYGIPSN